MVIVVIGILVGCCLICVGCDDGSGIVMCDAGSGIYVLVLVVVFGDICVCFFLCSFRWCGI